MKITNVNQYIKTSYLFNENIKMWGQTIAIKRCIEENVVFISQLINGNKFMTFTQFSMRYPTLKLDVITFNGILQSIRQNMKDLNLRLKDIKESKEATFQVQPHIELILNQEKGTKNIYKNICKSKPVKIRGITTWERRLAINIKQEEIFAKLKNTTQP